MPGAQAVAYNRLVRKLTTENLWLYILRLLKNGPLYGYEVREKISKEFGFKPGLVTCYVVLHMLEKEGLITSRKEDSGVGPPRKYYVLTDKGRVALEKAKKFLMELSHSL